MEEHNFTIVKQDGDTGEKWCVALDIGYSAVKVFSPNKTYVMTLSTTVNSESNGYHFENGNQALPITFKVVK